MEILITTIMSSPLGSVQQRVGTVKLLMDSHHIMTRMFFRHLLINLVAQINYIKFA